MKREQQLEGRFYQYMQELGEVDPEWNRRVLRHYVPYFAKCRSVLDVGCGQGDFLELLGTEGVEAVGIDIDRGMVDTCLQKGLRAVHMDVFDYLPQRSGQFDGIFNSNLIEHMSAAQATQFVQLAFDALASGGLFLVATPNPASPIVHLHEFWRDATHVRLYDRSLLEFLLDWAGFTEVRSDQNPMTAWQPPKPLRAVPEHLRALTALRRMLLSRADTRDSASAETEGAELKLPFDGEEGLSRLDTSWNRKTAALVKGSQRRSVLGGFVFSLRRRLARFLVDTVLFEEFAALRTVLADTSSRFSMVGSMSLTAQEIDKALYHSQNNILARPREVFASGVKPFASDQETA